MVGGGDPVPARSITKTTESTEITEKDRPLLARWWITLKRFELPVALRIGIRGGEWKKPGRILDLPSPYAPIPNPYATQKQEMH